MPLTRPASVIASLPRSGLGNRLLVWARAEAYAHRHGLRCVAVGWGKRSLGPYLRRERSKRLYGAYFRPDSLGEAVARLRVASGRVQWEPAFERPPTPGQVVGFREIPHWSDSFKDIRECRLHIIERLRTAVRSDVWEAVDRLPPPVIGVHVRRGDFSELPAAADFANVGHTRTPLGYFASVIGTLRSVSGAALPVTLFSDGHDAELASLLSLPNVVRAPESPDLIDLLHLARSRVIVVSAGSTFSMWSGFISDAALLLHPDHIHAPIRPPATGGKLYEGPGPTEVSAMHPSLFETINRLAT